MIPGRMVETSIVLFALALVGWMARGLAWGPGTHVHLTRHILDALARYKKPAAEHLLALEHPKSFLYGNIAADVINFKNFGGLKNHCHHWSMHERLVDQAETDADGAFILGYLCHLAADVVAHNHFVPYHLVAGLPPRVLGHAYWEAIADARTTDEEWEVVAAMRDDRALHHHDRLVWSAVRHRALGPRSNKWIFNNILLLSLRSSWRELVRAAHRRRTRHPLDRELLHEALGVCHHNMLAVFDSSKLAVLKLLDPTGRAALHGVSVLRREILAHPHRRRDLAELSRRLARSAYGKL